MPFSAQSEAEILTDIGFSFGNTFRISVKILIGNFNLFSILPPNSSVLMFVNGDKNEAIKNP